MDATNIVLTSILGFAVLALVAVMFFMANAMGRMNEAMTGLTHKFADQAVAISDVDLEKLRVHVEFLKRGDLPPDPVKPTLRMTQPYPNPDEFTVPMPGNPIT